MKNLEHFINNNLKQEVIDILIYLPDGSLLKDPNYEDYEVVDVNYEKKDDGIYCIINVKFK